MTASRYFSHPGGRVLAAGLTIGLISAGAAGAAGMHRLALSSGTGSEGAAATVQTSATGSALQGEVASSANTALRIPFGVLGEYNYAGSTFGIGVAGVSTTGYAVGAESFSTNPTMISLNESTGNALETYATGTSGSGYGIYSEAEGDGDGIDGIAEKVGWGGYFGSTGGIGVQGVSSASNAENGAAVYGLALGGSPAGYFAGANGNALQAVATTSTGAGILGDSNIGSRGILGDTTGEAVVGFGHSGNTHAALTGLDAVGGTDLLALYAYDSAHESRSFIVQTGTANRSGDAVASYSTDVQASGDVYVYGKIYQDCQTFPATSSTNCEPVTAGAGSTGSSVTRTSDGGSVQMYGTRESSPQVADEGSAELVNGKAYVRIDPAFARTMSVERPYKVFVTPSGSSRGVYVTGKTLQGFEVDENLGGRSTLQFDYRIVAAPFGDRSARLAAVTRKQPAAAVHEPGIEALRAQAEQVRHFDPNAAVAKGRALRNRHVKHPAPASFVTSMNGLHSR